MKHGSLYLIFNNNIYYESSIDFDIVLHFKLLIKGSGLRIQLRTIREVSKTLAYLQYILAITNKYGLLKAARNRDMLIEFMTK